MKKYIVLFILLWAASGWCQKGITCSGTTIAGAGVAAAATNYCTAATTCNDPPGQCDDICEDFEGSGDCGDDAGDAQTCQGSWTFSVSGTSTITANNTPSAGYPSTWVNTKNVKMVVQNNEMAIMVKDIGATEATKYAQLWIYINSEGLADTQFNRFFQMSDGVFATACIGAGVIQQSGSLYFQTFYRDDSGAVAVDYTTTAISIGKWYGVRLGWSSNALAVMYVNFTGSSWTKIYENTSTVYTRSCDYIAVGSRGDSDSSDAMTYEIDNIAIDDDTIQN